MHPYPLKNNLGFDRAITQSRMTKNKHRKKNALFPPSIMAFGCLLHVLWPKLFYSSIESLAREIAHVHYASIYVYENHISKPCGAGLSVNIILVENNYEQAVCF